METKEQQLDLFGNQELSKRERDKESKKFVESLMSIFRPKIVMPHYIDMPIPENIHTQILIERLILARNQERLATETETLWYLSTASLMFPLDNNWYNIFMYLTRRWLIKTKKELPDFLKENIVLEKYMEENELYKLRAWIYRKGMEHINGLKNRKV